MPGSIIIGKINYHLVSLDLLGICVVASWVIYLIDELEFLHIDWHRMEKHDYRASQSPLQENSFRSKSIFRKYVLIFEAHAGVDKLDYQK